MNDNAETKHSCPVCGKYEFEERDSFDMCPVCGWFDDNLQLIEPDLSGRNKLCLNEYRKKWQAGEIEPPIIDNG